MKADRVSVPDSWLEESGTRYRRAAPQYASGVRESWEPAERLSLQTMELMQFYYLARRALLRPAMAAWRS
jgi:hypothetical protein